MIIVIGDVHNKQSIPYRKAVEDFFEWVCEKYDPKETTIIQTGDYLDTSRPHSEQVLDISAGYATTFKHFHIVGGNHEVDHRFGNPLKIFNRLPNVSVYLEKTEVEIEGKKFLMLPYYRPLKDMNKEYSNLKWSGDYAVCHFAFPGTNFGHMDEIELTGIDAICIYGHIHKFQYSTKRDIVIGVPQSTRYGEHEWDKKIVEITDAGPEIIDVPEFISYHTIEYGEPVPEGNCIVHIQNAPSRKLIQEKYFGYQYDLLHSTIQSVSKKRVVNYEQQREKLTTDLSKRYAAYAEKELTDYTDDVHEYVLSKL